MAYDSPDFSAELAEITVSAVSPSAPVIRKIEGSEGQVVWKKRRWMVRAVTESEAAALTPPWARASRADAATRSAKMACDAG